MLHDFQGLNIRLTDERLHHIQEHPEMKAMLKAIKETIIHPIKVVQSISDKSARLYYRYYLGTKVGDKYLCVVVKVSLNDAFVLTAYLTDKMKKGEILWPKK